MSSSLDALVMPEEVVREIVVTYAKPRRFTESNPEIFLQIQLNDAITARSDPQRNSLIPRSDSSLP
jgi:hypothetical protein